MQTLLEYLMLFGVIGIVALLSTATLLFILRVQSNRRKGKHTKPKIVKTHKWTLRGRKEIEPEVKEFESYIPSEKVEELKTEIKEHTGKEIPESREKINNVVGVIGSRRFHNKEIIFQTLDDLFGGRDKDNIIFVTGDAKGPDEWLVDWAKSRGFQYDSFDVLKGESTFDRNGRIAATVNAIVAFVPKGLYKTGCRNCISQFKEMGKSLYLVYDQFGNKWDWKSKDE